MKRISSHSVSRRPQRGFSLTELVVTLAIGLVLMAIATPALMRAYRSYQLTGAASQMADILRLTRYEAIRQNSWVKCEIAPSTSDAGMTVVWSDTNRNTVQDGSEKMILLGGSGNLVDPGGVPGTATLIATAVGGTGVTSPSPTSSRVKFDARGATDPPQVNVFYLSGSSVDAGYRAVLLMPAGSIQIWTGDAAGHWQQIR
jgi:prepilin-type N-terminal cleavage/methylation domain-containing protein